MPPPPGLAAVLTDVGLLRHILERLSPCDLVRLALACQPWRRAFARAIPRDPPLIGFFHPQPKKTGAQDELPAVFVPCDASFTRLSLPLSPEDPSGVQIRDVRLGLVLLFPSERPEIFSDRILVVDPVCRSRALLPPPPHDARPDGQSRHIIGATVLSRSHPSKLCFQIICVTLEDELPTAWVASFHEGECFWRAIPPSKQATTKHQPKVYSLETQCLHMGGKIYWHICDSCIVLVLDALSLEFSFLPSSSESRAYFSKHGFGGMPDDGRLCSSYFKDVTVRHMECGHGPVFSYYLSWPPSFLMLAEEATHQIMLMVRIALYNICHKRRLFPEGLFSNMFTEAAGSQVKILNAGDAESKRLVDWVERGVNDALEKNFLKTILFCIKEDGGSLIEEYCLRFSYGEGIVMELCHPGGEETIWTFQSNTSESTHSHILSSASILVENLKSLMSTLKDIPQERIILVKLFYYDDLTPLNYEPPFFECCDDATRTYHKQLQTSSQNVTRAMAKLCTHDAASVPINDPCRSNKGLPSDSNIEIPRGFLYCITKKKKVIFYFDSGATYHTCNDKSLIVDLKMLPMEHWAKFYEADGEPTILKEAGRISYGQINLSPVFYDPGSEFNCISMGELDDGNNIIYLGGGRIRIFDTNEGILIGEGCLHETENEYIAKSINSLHSWDRTLQTVEDISVGIQPNFGKLQWCIDSLCSRHMTGKQKILQDRRDCKAEKFVTPKGEFWSAGIGNVKTKHVTLFDVLYCPVVRSNLISEGQLDRDGYSCTRFNHKCTIQRRTTQKIVGEAYQDDGNYLYYVNQLNCSPEPKIPNEGEESEPSLKRQRQDGPSASSRKKR